MKNRGLSTLLTMLLPPALIGALCLAAAGCAANAPPSAGSRAESYTDSSASESGALPMAEAESAPLTPDAGFTSAQSVKKVIVSGVLNMETNRFATVISDARQAVSANGGYMEISEVYARAGKKGALKEFRATLKIPAERYEAARARLEELGTVTYYEENVEDASTRYMDVESRLETKRIEEQRLLALAETAVSDENASIESILALEERLGEIREQIELYEAQINSINAQTAYSTLQLTVIETAEPGVISASPDLLRRMIDSAGASAQLLIDVSAAVAVFLAAAIPPLGILAVLGALWLVIVKKLIPAWKARNLR